MDPVTLLAGAGILLVGMLIGRAARLRRRLTLPQPICGCDHHYAMHDPVAGTCKATVTHTVNYIEKLNECTCRVYTGPAPTQVIWRDGVAMLPPSSG